MKKIFLLASISAIFLCDQYSYSQTIVGRFGINIMTTPSGALFTSLLSSGSVGAKYDIVFVGDGFTASEQGIFNADVDNVLSRMRNTPPYSTDSCAFNIWRVNVVSPESGVDHPGRNIFRNTALDCTYNNATNVNAERCVGSNSPAKCYAAAGNAPATDALIVIVNDLQLGGCSAPTGIIFCSMPAAGIVVHELGHHIGALADEYMCYLCDGSDGGRRYFGIEPGQANITATSNRATTKWASLISASTPLPTSSDTPPGVVGLWQGGSYYATGIFHAQANCMMNNGAPMCAVCINEMRRILTPFEQECSSAMPITVRPHFIIPTLALSVLRFRLFDESYIVHWPVPHCYYCREGTMRIILDGISSKQFLIEIIDGKNKQVTNNNNGVDNKSTEISFNHKPGIAYTLQISARNKTATGKMNTVSVSVLFNNSKMELE